MLNYNYNVQYCRLNKPQGFPFVPQPRIDPYSSSLVLAIPGNIFRAGYVNVFNQINVFDDISGYITSGSTYDVVTGKYTPMSATQSLYVSASTQNGYNTPGYITGSTISNFSSAGYETSVMATGSVSAVVALSGSTGQGVNITLNKPWVIEGWFASVATSSYYTYPASEAPGQVFTNGNPSATLAKRYAGNSASHSFIVQVGWEGNTSAIGSVPPDELVIQQGAILTVVDTNVQEYYAFPQSSTNANTSSLSWAHYAISFSTGSYPYNPTIREYVNGNLVGTKEVSGNLVDDTYDVPLELFNTFVYDLSISQSSQPAGFFQDFKMYNGTNKLYTGSVIPIPPSMVIGLQEPYPQYS